VKALEGAETREKQPAAAADPISAEDAAKLLGRMPAIKSDPGDASDFAKRTGTLPAPKTGEKIPVKFPSAEQRNAPNSDPSKQSLEVVRFSPEGEVSLAPDLNITFSHPMVAVTSQEEAAKYAPVELSPSVEGRWRWLGTKTLMFDTEKRFPMATKFTARIPAGTKSATGQILQKDFTWNFTTPAPKAIRMIPSGQTTTRDAVIYIAFDQAINPEAVLRSINVSAGGKRLPIRLATQEEVNANGTIANFAKQEQPGRWLAFRAVGPGGSVGNALPGNSQITVTIEKGTPSAEGPLTTAAAQTFSFSTFGPMSFVDAECGWRSNANCSPFEQWNLEFSNSIDGSSFTSDMVKIEPAVEGLKIYPAGNYIYIQGVKKGRTTYKITVDGQLKDIFGQTLGRPATATIKVGSADQSLYSQGGPMVVLDPLAKPSYSIYTVNHSSVRVKVYRVTPEDWHQYQDYFRYRNYDDGKQRILPGTVVSDKIIQIERVADEMTETRIDLAPYLNGGFGNLILSVEPTVRQNQYDRASIVTWAQATQIGLDAFVDNTELVGFATELATGKPVSGVGLSIFPNNGTSGGQLARSDEEEGGFLATAWNWLIGTTGAGGPSSEALDPSGNSAEIENVEPTQSNTTGNSGVLRLLLADRASDKGMNILIARKGKDVAFLPENSDSFWQDHGSWHKKIEGDSLQWFVFDDRRMYKPNEEVAVKGYIRKRTAGKLGDIEGLGGQKLSYAWTAKDPRDNEVAKGTISTNAFGAFDLKFKLPDNANLGYARVDFIETGGTNTVYSHQYQIQEFRRPEFEVSAKVETEAPHFVGGRADVSVEAKYYSGGGLASADTNWVVSASPTNYTPPNRDDFVFGVWTPWWRIYDYYGGRPGGQTTTQTFKGVTDASGKHVLRIDFDSVKPPRPYTVTANASVQDVNRQTWASSATMLVHPSTLYVGIKTPRTFVQKGEKIDIESIVSDIDGKLIAGRDIEIKAVLKDWTFDKGTWKEVTVDEQNCDIRSAESAVKCSFIAKSGGRYTITATVMDDRERYNQSEMTIWVPGGKTPPSRDVEQEEVQLIPSKKDYQPGEVAEFLVISPFSPAEGILTLRRDGIVKTERFTINESSMTLKFKIEEAYLPNIYAQVDLVGAAARQNDKGEVDPKLSKRPAFASGNLNLPVSIASRKLTVSAEPKDRTLVPGGETKVDIEVNDSRGEPVANSEVAVVIVDESVLALTGYSVADPASIFYSQRSSGTQDYYLRRDILLGNPDDLQSAAPPPPPAPVQTSDASIGEGFKSRSLTIAGARAASQEISIDGALAADPSISVRQNFDALAVFAPSVRTDANGRATVDVKLPDNLTRYRITAVSVDTGKRFGKAESSITAKQPLMVRPSAPRFMNFGDKIELPVVVQNQTDQDMAVDVAVRATNANLSNGGGRRVLVKANSREEVRFPVATEKAGTARFQIAVSSGKHTDAAEISLPVWTPATSEAFATYGTTDENGAIFQPVQTPGDVYPQFGGLEVTTSSTQLQELTDAFIYLTNYPFACSEQISSRMISIAALRDVLQAFKAKDTPTAAELDEFFKRDIQILQSRQRNDGSFGLWKRDRERYEYPFLTVHVAHALGLAKAKGYKVPDEMITKVKPYLKNVENYYKDQWYVSSPEVRWTISAYALYVRDMLGDKDIAKAKKLLAEATIEKMPFEALGWVLSVLANDPGSSAEVEAIKRFLMNRTTETASTANFVTNYGDGAWLIMYSNRRADGVLLEAMIKADPNNDLVPKLVRGLLANRKKGHWGSTQENVFILLALDKYFNAFEKVTPDFVTRVWLGNAYAGEQAFKGRSVDSNVLNIPMSYLTDQGGTSNLILEKQGAGRLYYRIGMKYAPTNLKLEPADYGFTVLRKYEAIDNADDVKQNADGSWSIKSGARVRVRLTMVAQARRYHVALVDNLPAGLEILNPGLAVTEAIPSDDRSTPIFESGSWLYGRNSYWWRQYWFEHQNFRDERAEAFASLLWEGVYNYSYVTRATTPGRFTAPPAKAEEMYAPETFGRTGSDFVNVE
jgi:alpha-2-macroglobulin